MKLTDYHLDVLTELVNIGVGRAASILNEMLHMHIWLQVPFVRQVSLEELPAELKAIGTDRFATVQMAFRGAFGGMAALVFPPDSASNLVAALTCEQPGGPELDSVRAGTLAEAGNIVINGVLGSIGNVLDRRLEYSIPSYTEDTLDNLIGEHAAGQEPVLLLARTRFTVKTLHIDGDFLLLFEFGSFDVLLQALGSFAGRFGE